MLPDLVLLEIFHFYVDQTASVDVWQTVVHVSKMAEHRFWVTTSPASATYLLERNTCEGDAECLAILTHHHEVL